MAVRTCIDMPTLRTIKKYSNRRLYDTANSCYITLAEVREIVLNQEEIVVVDSESGEDITRQILLQIVSDQELGGQPMFTTELLIQMIRFSGGGFQNVFTDYLEKAMQMVANQQQAYQRQMAEMMNADLMNEMGDMAMRNMNMMNELQQQFMKNYGLQPRKEEK